MSGEKNQDGVPIPDDNTTKEEAIARAESVLELARAKKQKAEK